MLMCHLITQGESTFFGIYKTRTQKWGYAPLQVSGLSHILQLVVLIKVTISISNPFELPYRRSLQGKVSRELDDRNSVHNS